MMDILSRSLGPLTTIETSYPVRLPTILTDPNQLEMAILNLVVNARDAMPSGGRIVLRASEESIAAGKGPLSAGRYVRIAIIDEGEGMDTKTLEQAVTPFFTTKGVGKGTGLGLSMVQGLATQSGGRLILKSRPGEGTTAELWFPIAAVEQRVVAPADVPQPDSDAQRRLRIVAVDDDGLVLMNTTLMLEDLGHTVFEAMAGPEALDILRKEPVDLVICDHAMPRMTGAQLAEAIRSEWPEMPIILATGYADLPDGAGAANLPRLGKPFSQAQLADAISRVAAQGA
jgi:CheY-like chemotaxis protein